jgi:hypothetical protein
VFAALLAAMSSGGGGGVRVRELDLSWTAVTDASLVLLAAAAEGSLEKLKLCGCRHLGRRSITSGGVGALAACTKLQVLKLFDCPLVDDACIQALAQGCRKMRELSVPACYSLTPHAVLPVAQAHEKARGGSSWRDSLTRLDLSRLPLISEVRAALFFLFIDADAPRLISLAPHL